MEVIQQDLGQLEAEVAEAEAALKNALKLVTKPEASLLAWKASFSPETRPQNKDLATVMVQIQIALLQVFQLTKKNIRGTDINSSGRVHKLGAAIGASGLLRGVEMQMIRLINARVALVAAEEGFAMPHLEETGAKDEEVATETRFFPAHHVHGQVMLDSGVHLADVVISSKPLEVGGMPLLRGFTAERIFSALAGMMNEFQKVEPDVLSMNLRGLSTPIQNFEYNPLKPNNGVSVHFTRALTGPLSPEIAIAMKLQSRADFTRYLAGAQVV